MINNEETLPNTSSCCTTPKYVQIIRTIRELLYEHGFTIGGARQKLEQENNKPAKSAAPKNAESIKQIIGELEEVLALLKV